MSSQIFVEGGWRCLDELNADLSADNLIAVDRRVLAALVMAAGGTIDVTLNMLAAADGLTLIQSENMQGGLTMRAVRSTEPPAAKPDDA